MNQIDLHKNWMTIAFQVSLQSNCVHSPSGCVLLNEQGRIVSTGSCTQPGTAKCNHLGKASNDFSTCGSQPAEKTALQYVADTRELHSGYFTHMPDTSELESTGLVNLYYAYAVPSQVEEIQKWVSSKPGRTATQVCVLEFMWLSVDDIPDGLYRCNDFDSNKIFQKSGPQMYQGLTVFEVSGPMLFQRIPDAAFPYPSPHTHPRLNLKDYENVTVQTNQSKSKIEYILTGTEYDPAKPAFVMAAQCDYREWKASGSYLKVTAKDQATITQIGSNFSVVLRKQ